MRFDFDRLKRLVSIEHVLQVHGLLDRLRPRGERLVGPCPLHNGDNPTAFVVSRPKNLWHCFSQCGRGGDVIDLVRILHRCSYHDCARYLAALADGVEPDAAKSQASPPRTPTPFRPFTRTLALNPHCSLLRTKGISLQTATTFEAGTYLGRGFLEGTVGLRLHDLDGSPLGYAGRALPTSTRPLPKWRFPPRINKASLLYNHHRIGDLGSTAAIVLVECPWGVMRLHQLGIPAVALLGTSLSLHQKTVLETLPQVLVMLDGDQAGRLATPRILARLGSRAKPLVLPPDHDPDDLDDDALMRIVHPALHQMP